MNTPASLRSELIAIRSESLIDIAGIASYLRFVGNCLYGGVAERVFGAARYGDLCGRKRGV